MKNQILSEIFKKMWDHYKEKVSYVKIVERAIHELNDTWSEDHIAFRTLPGIYTGAHVLEKLFVSLGYTRKDNYRFEDKKLNAFWLEPPENKSQNSTLVSPKIFVSELDLKTFSPEFKKTVESYTSNVSQPIIENILSLKENNNDAFINAISTFLTHGPLWRRPSYKDYQTLQKESEYAAWTLIFGNIPNHFTVSVHLMNQFKNLEDLNNKIEKELKIPLNSTGGKIKGTPEVQLEQSSTLADFVWVQFQDRVEKIPYAFIEFAYRYPLDDSTTHQKSLNWNEYYQGFVTNNADKIFESTNRR